MSEAALDSSAPLILAVDDNQDALFALEQVLIHHGYRVVTAQSAEAAFEIAQEELPAVILLDVVMPRITGYELTKQMKADPRLKYIPLILVTANDSLKDLVYGLEQGADGYITKPYQPDELIARVRAALRLSGLYEQLRVTQQRNVQLTQQLSSTYTVDNMIGRSPAISRVFDLVRKVADSESPVLITGESGTGKELIARALHFQSDRTTKPFVARNCAAFVESLLESELFGHIRGSFTGAVRDSRGVFEMADGGTLFLDEIGEMPPTMQAKLLRVLQDGTVVPVGSTVERRVHVRVIAATNRDLARMVSEGKFREDLYYRLHVIDIHLPPLRERAGDVRLLIEHFLNRDGVRRGGRVKEISEEALRLLEQYPWPGNIRELQNEVERMLILGRENDELDISVISSRISRDVPASNSDGTEAEDSGSPLRDAIEQLEQQMILGALERTQGNKSAAAKELGISRSNLIAKVQQFGLESDSAAHTKRGKS